MSKENHRDIEKKIFSTFAEVANSIGYSPIHGNIIGVLLVNDRPLSLQEIAKETGYSTSMVSISLDLLEVLGTIKKMKVSGDRKLYIALQGDLLEILKNAVLIKVKKSIADSLVDFKKSKEELQKYNSKEREKSMKKVDILEKEIKRLQGYIEILSEIKLP